MTEEMQNITLEPKFEIKAAYKPNGRPRGYIFLKPLLKCPYCSMAREYKTGGGNEFYKWDRHIREHVKRGDQRETLAFKERPENQTIDGGAEQ